MDGAKLSRKDEALVRTTAGGLNEEMKVVNSLLELADQLEGKIGFPIGRGEPEMPDDDEYLVQKRGRDRDGGSATPTSENVMNGIGVRISTESSGKCSTPS